MSEPRSELISPEELHRREMQSILHRITRLRLVLIPVAVAFLTLVVLFDSASFKVFALGVVVVLLSILAVFDLRRLRRPRYDVVFDPLIAVFLQTGLIWMTGALESPLLVIYVPLTLLSGISLGPSPARVLVLGLASLLLWAMALTGLLGWVPRTLPSFLDLGPGFYDRPTYVLTKTAILNLVMIVASFAGLAIHRLVRRVLEQGIAAREQALELVLHRNRELHELSSAIAHELKNPLASISGLVQLLGRRREQGAGNDEREAARLEVLRAEVARMQTSLDEMLNFTRPLGPLALEEVSLGRLIAELSALHEGRAASRELTIAPPPEGALSVRGDARKLKQALVNLLQNALEASPRGGEVSWIARAAEGGAFVEIGVRDHGPGLPPEILARGPRVGATTKPAGSGIGLAVACAIAEQHGGSLALENPEGGGCLALLRLPASPRETP
jgi:signal transduction histidine kinase